MFLPDEDDKMSKPKTMKQPPPDVLADGWGPYITRSVNELFLSTKLNYLLCCIPIAMMSKAGGGERVSE